MRADAGVAAAGASRSQENMLELLLDPVHSEPMDCPVSSFILVQLSCSPMFFVFQQFS